MCTTLLRVLPILIDKHPVTVAVDYGTFKMRDYGSLIKSLADRSAREAGDVPSQSRAVRCGAIREGEGDIRPQGTVGEGYCRWKKL